jgi:regulator of sigma E protease
MDLLLIPLTIVWLLLVLSFLVLIHELGHFLAAKWIGTHVEEFGLGYPPLAKKLFTKWHTVFTLNWLPFGGFVRIWGDDAEQLEDPEAKKENGEERISNPPPQGAIPFAEQPKWKRLIVILAGVVVNLVFGVFAFGILFSVIGIPERTGNVTISAISEGSPAEGVLQPGDEVLRMETRDYSEVEIFSTEEFRYRIQEARGNEVILDIKRGEEELTLAVIPRTQEETPEGQGSLGVGLTNNTIYTFFPWYEMPFRGMAFGLQSAMELSVKILEVLSGLITGLFFEGKVSGDVSGVVGMAEEAVKQEVVLQGWQATLNWAGLISINLAVMNLLPIPALDGGRAMFILLETFIGKARRLRWERKVNGYSFFFLLGLIILISIKDIVSIFL